MHHLKGPRFTDFNFNSDLSGNVVIRPHGGKEFMVPGEDLIALVAHWVRNQRVEQLEAARDYDVLGVFESRIPC